MSSISEDQITEAMRLIRTQERVGSLVAPLEIIYEQINGILDIYPELQPEMGAILDRMNETTNHVRAALAVLEAKVALL